MRVECEKLSERVATPELIRELVRDGARRVSAREVEAAFLDEYDGRLSWRDRYTWEPIEGYGPSSSANGSRLLSVKNLAWILPLVFALVYFE